MGAERREKATTQMPMEMGTQGQRGTDISLLRGMLAN
jgi:hypothetical protein